MLKSGIRRLTSYITLTSGIYDRTFDAGFRDVWREKPINFTSGNKLHQAEKPLNLIKKMILNSSNEGDLILDTHLGSASIAIACHREKFSLVGCELVEEYYINGLKRLENEQMQTTLF